MCGNLGKCNAAVKNIMEERTCTVTTGGLKVQIPLDADGETVEYVKAIACSMWDITSGQYVLYGDEDKPWHDSNIVTGGVFRIEARKGKSPITEWYIVDPPVKKVIDERDRLTQLLESRDGGRPDPRALYENLAKYFNAHGAVICDWMKVEMNADTIVIGVRAQTDSMFKGLKPTPRQISYCARSKKYKLYF